MIDRAVEILRAGGLVAFPTETVYGLGADARNDAAVRKVFAAKGRPADHPLIVHVADARELESWAASIPAHAHLLARRFWPGPLTLVLAARRASAATGGLSTIALRVPDHPIALELLRAFGSGIAAPSANRFGAVSATEAAHVRAELGDAVDLVLDGGPCRIGLESTIVDLTSDVPRLLRPGGVPIEDLEHALGVEVVRGGTTKAPGTLPSHYAPRAEVRALRAERIAETVTALRGRKVVVLGPRDVEGAARIDLPEEPSARAARLYAALRAIDDGGYEIALVALPEPRGIDEAVVDRLKRASAPRR